MTNEASEVLVHEAAGYCFLLVGEQLVIRREDQEQARLNLAPATDRQWGLETWRREGDRYVAAVKGRATSPCRLEAEVVVGLTPGPSPHGSEKRGDYGYLFYEVRTQEEFFPSLIYFPDSRLSASRWQTFVYNSDDRAWVADQDKEVGVTAASVVLGEVQAAWYANVAPHVAAYCLTPSPTDCRLPIADCRLPESGLRQIANRKSQIANREERGGRGWASACLARCRWRRCGSAGPAAGSPCGLIT